MLGIVDKKTVFDRINLAASVNECGLVKVRSTIDVDNLSGDKTSFFGNQE